MRRLIRPACPTPTSPSRLPAIAREVSAAIAAGVPPNTLAREWERLDAGARICRGEP